VEQARGHALNQNAQSVIDRLFSLTTLQGHIPSDNTPLNLITCVGM